MKKATKRQILEAANEGNWFYSGGEDRCKHCGEYRFTDKHREDCPMGSLLHIINTHLPGDVEDEDEEDETN